jgi:hypothetical protein
LYGVWGEVLPKVFLAPYFWSVPLYNLFINLFNPL